jgi:hypothetical protein
MRLAAPAQPSSLDVRCRQELRVSVNLAASTPADTPTQATSDALRRTIDSSEIAHLISKRTPANARGPSPVQLKNPVSAVRSRPSAPSSYLNEQVELPLDRTRQPPSQQPKAWAMGSGRREPTVTSRMLV